MKNSQNHNIFLEINKIFREVIAEAKNLTFPSIKETILNTLFIIILSMILCVYFLGIGKISIQLLKLIGA
jgi:preprotein translocase SecE subunit